MKGIKERLKIAMNKPEEEDKKIKAKNQPNPKSLALSKVLSALNAKRSTSNKENNPSLANQEATVKTSRNIKKSSIVDFAEDESSMPLSNRLQALNRRSERPTLQNQADSSLIEQGICGGLGSTFGYLTGTHHLSQKSQLRVDTRDKIEFGSPSSQQDYLESQVLDQRLFKVPADQHLSGAENRFFSMKSSSQPDIMTNFNENFNFRFEDPHQSKKGSQISNETNQSRKASLLLDEAKKKSWVSNMVKREGALFFKEPRPGLDKIFINKKQHRTYEQSSQPSSKNSARNHERSASIQTADLRGRGSVPIKINMKSPLQSTMKPFGQKRKSTGSKLYKTNSFSNMNDLAQNKANIKMRLNQKKHSNFTQLDENLFRTTVRSSGKFKRVPSNFSKISDKNAEKSLTTFRVANRGDNVVSKLKKRIKSPRGFPNTEIESTLANKQPSSKVGRTTLENSQREHDYRSKIKTEMSIGVQPNDRLVKSRIKKFAAGSKTLFDIHQEKLSTLLSYKRRSDRSVERKPRPDDPCSPIKFPEFLEKNIPSFSCLASLNFKDQPVVIDIGDIFNKSKGPEEKNQTGTMTFTFNNEGFSKKNSVTSYREDNSNEKTAGRDRSKSNGSRACTHQKYKESPKEATQVLAEPQSAHPLKPFKRVDVSILSKIPARLVLPRPNKSPISSIQPETIFKTQLPSHANKDKDPITEHKLKSPVFEAIKPRLQLDLDLFHGRIFDSAESLLLKFQPELIDPIGPCSPEFVTSNYLKELKSSKEQEVFQENRKQSNQNQSLSKMNSKDTAELPANQLADHVQRAATILDTSDQSLEHEINAASYSYVEIDEKSSQSDQCMPVIREDHFGYSSKDYCGKMSIISKMTSTHLIPLCLIQAPINQTLAIPISFTGPKKPLSTKSSKKLAREIAELDILASALPKPRFANQDITKIEGSEHNKAVSVDDREIKSLFCIKSIDLNPLNHGDTEENLNLIEREYDRDSFYNEYSTKKPPKAGLKSQRNYERGFVDPNDFSLSPIAPHKSSNKSAARKPKSKMYNSSSDIPNEGEILHIETELFVDKLDSRCISDNLYQIQDIRAAVGELPNFVAVELDLNLRQAAPNLQTSELHFADATAHTQRKMKSRPRDKHEEKDQQHSVIDTYYLSSESQSILKTKSSFNYVSYLNFDLNSDLKKLHDTKERAKEDEEFSGNQSLSGNLRVLPKLFPRDFEKSSDRTFAFNKSIETQKDQLRGTGPGCTRFDKEDKHNRTSRLNFFNPDHPSESNSTRLIQKQIQELDSIKKIVEVDESRCNIESSSSLIRHMSMATSSPDFLHQERPIILEIASNLFMRIAEQNKQSTQIKNLKHIIERVKFIKSVRNENAIIKAAQNSYRGSLSQRSLFLKNNKKSKTVSFDPDLKADDSFDEYKKELRFDHEPAHHHIAETKSVPKVPRLNGLQDLNQFISSDPRVEQTSSAEAPNTFSSRYLIEKSLNQPSSHRLDQASACRHSQKSIDYSSFRRNLFEQPVCFF